MIVITSNKLLGKLNSIKLLSLKGSNIIKAGDVFAQSGNTGTQPSTMGIREESHLHWELILQDAKREFYFNQNLPYEKLYPAVKSLFNN